jgi:hypothetical protein
MLPFRSMLITLTAGVFLWGLFSLLDNLQKPELLRSTKAIVVKGCDPMESDEAMRLCPELFCQKALLDGKYVPISTRFQVVTHENVPVERTHVRQMIIGTGTPSQPAAAERWFECVMENSKVSSVRVL